MKFDKNMLVSHEDLSFTTGESFADLWGESQRSSPNFEGYVAKGRVVDVTKDFVVLSVGLKSEARVDLKEFRNEDVKLGDEVDIFIERYEGADGTLVASREKARKEAAWKDIEAQVQSAKVLKGEIVERVRGGFTVDLGGISAFMPSSQLDSSFGKDFASLMHKPLDFKIIKMDRARSNLIVSQRAVADGSRAERRSEILKSIKVGSVMDGTVKNITDYGVFIDLGGVDGLLHITDISWKRVGNPNDIFQIGQKTKVKVINFDPETSRISLGLKQLEDDPWLNLSGFEIGRVYPGKVTNLTDYGAFVDLGGGIEGLIHISELSWTKKNLAPSKVLSVGQDISVMVLEIDREKRRISLGLKQTQANPWTDFETRHNVGEAVKGEVKNITEFGIFVTVEGTDLDGMVHLNDISWDKDPEEAVKDYQKGQMIEAKILEIDTDKERISLGIKQLSKDVVADTLDALRKGQVVTCVIREVVDGGLTVEASGVRGFIKTSELSKNRAEQHADRFAVGEKVDAKIINIDAKTRQLSLSIKAYEQDEEKRAIKEYGSADSGALLGDILGAATAEKEKKKKK
jgi:small subunit ribosomal protein S1